MKLEQVRQALRAHKKGISVAGASLIVGSITALLMHTYLEGQTQAIEEKYKGKLVPVVVARIDIQPGTPLNADILAARNIPTEFAQSSSISPDNYEGLIGRTVAHAMKKGDVITYASLDGPKTATFSARVAKGRRAITVPVDDINSISGMLEPDDRIDLIASDERNGYRVSYPLLQQVRVLATGQRTVNDSKTGEQRQFSTVTLDISPIEAQRIIAARDQGRLSALLRNPQDTENLISEIKTDTPRRTGQRMAFAARREIPILYGGRPAQPGGGEPTAIRVDPAASMSTP
jgi:pilus assembly protein CpaB